MDRARGPLAEKLFDLPLWAVALNVLAIGIGTVLLLSGSVLRGLVFLGIVLLGLTINVLRQRHRRAR